MTIKTVALFGANGNLGTVALQSLVSSGHFRVTVIKRESSPYSLPPSLSTPSAPVALRTVDDALSPASLRAALAGMDAVVVSIPLRDPAQHLRIADAAAAAGVRRVIPADYGSCDSDSPRAQALVPLFAHKAAVRARLQALSATAAAAPGGDFSWTSLVVGHFFDWGLRENFLHFDLGARTAEILDHGRYRSSTATLARVGEAVVRILAADEEGTRNRVLFVQSFCVSQLDVLAALERATGGAKWEVRFVESEAFIADRKGKADAGDKDAVEDLVFALGALDGNWEGREGFAMDLLGLENEDLDEVVQRVVDSTQA
ncbi:NmrA-like family protein [Hypoxylon argillaceum]|nr:NmrA-like family protein [Hypoxylon argillaceum]KAI1150577.1 NmrA-like family protein [Nemania diffusa]